MSKNGPLFTVFTATYNRAHVLPRVMESLQAQTFQDFEWLIVDDGSVDNTKGLVDEWREMATFPIRYFLQPHRGKHIAHNLAVREAHGELFAPLDSDDLLPPDALEKVFGYWTAIPVAERGKYTGIAGLCANEFGSIIGDLYPGSPFDSSGVELLFVRRVRGEKWGVTRTDILRGYPFPDLTDTQYVPEGIIDLAISRKYKWRCVNEVLRIYCNQNCDASRLTNRMNLARSAPGRLYYCLWLLNNEMEFFRHAPFPFAKAAILLPFLAWHSEERFCDVWRRLVDHRAKMLVLAVYPFSLMLELLHRSQIIVSKTGQ